METIPYKIQIISIIGTLLFLAFVGRLVIRGKLREEYSLIWLLCATVLLLLSTWRNGLDYLAQIFGVFYPPSLLFLFLLCAVIGFLVHLSVVNSRQHEQIKKLTHEIAILKQHIDTLNEDYKINSTGTQLPI